MKVVVQIPCFNEAETLAETLADIPGCLPGCLTIERLVVDDGSTDGTAEQAHAGGAEHVISLGTHQGLAAAFTTGIDSALKLGADIIVNTDGDHQYRGEDLAALIEPILTGRADVTVGHRDRIGEGIRRPLHRIGNFVVRLASGVSIADAPCGFRAFSREAALGLMVFGTYTYTLETIIQAGRGGLRVVSVPISVNAPTRPSRLIRSTGQYVLQSTFTIVRIFLTYRPFVFFAIPGFLFTFLTICMVPLWRITGQVGFMFCAAAFLFLGVQFFLVGLLANLMAVNRRLLQEIRIGQRRVFLSGDESQVGSAKVKLRDGQAG